MSVCEAFVCVFGVMGTQSCLVVRLRGYKCVDRFVLVYEAMQYATKA